MGALRVARRKQKLWGDPGELESMKYVYILRSEKNPAQTYVGCTVNLNRRLRDHNSGQSEYTRQFMPWRLETYLAFSEHSKAAAFEKYLKHGSGYAFLKRHF